MKTRFFSAGILTLVIFLTAAMGSFSEEKKAERHWYLFQIQTGSTTYQCFGSSVLGEKEMAKQLVGTDYIALDDLVYRDNQGKIKAWQEWDPAMGSRVYVNPKYVIFFQPLEGDPRKSSKEH